MGWPVDCGQGDHLGAVASALVVYIVLSVPLLLAIVYAAWKAVSHARVAQMYEQILAGTSSRGVVRALRGTIVTDEAVPFAARVEIDQRGKTWTQKNRTYHSWTETARRVDAHPFMLETQVGLVQVEAGRDLLLCTPFSRTTGDSSDRAIIAQVDKGHEVVVVGRVFERGSGSSASVYRGGGQPRTVMRAPAGQRLVISTLPLVEAFKKRMWFHVKWLALMLAVGAATHGVAFLGYHYRQLGGVADTAIVKAKRSVRGSKSTSYYLNLSTPEGRALGEESSSSSCYAAVTNGTEVRVLMDRADGSVMQLGAKPTVNGMFVLLAAFATAGALMGYWAGRRTKGPWYLRSRVDMRGDGPANVGSLPEA